MGCVSIPETLMSPGTSVCMTKKEMIIKETVAAESGYDFADAVSLAEIKTVGGM